MDQHVIGAGPEQPDDVGGRLRIEVWTYPAFSGQVANDVGRALSTLRKVGLPESASVGIDAGRPPYRFMDGRQPTVHLGYQFGIQREVFAWIELGSNCL